MSIDPHTVSTALATIIGLICNYRQEKGGREELTQQRFMNWLDEHRHTEIKNLISETHYLRSEVDALLRQDLKELTGRLQWIELMLSNLLSRLEGFGGIVRSLNPEASISSGAFEILKLMVEGEGRFVQPFQDSNDVGILMVTKQGNAAIYPVSESLFLDDDIDSLLRHGLVLQDYDGSGAPLFKITRAGVAYIAGISRSEASGLSGS